MNFRSKNSGFTLLEVLIAMTLMVFISIAIYQATTKTFELRDILSVEGDFFSEIRLSMGIMENDVGMLYSPVIIIPPEKTPSNAQTPPTQAQDNAPAEIASKFWGGFADNTGIRHMRFIGSDNSMSFVTTSNIRVYKNSIESIFKKVVYRIESEQRDENTDESMAGTMVLVKTENPNAFDTEEDEGNLLKKYSLIHGVKKLQFRYYRKEKDDWFKNWDSETDNFKNIYPDVIEVEIEVIGPQRHAFEGKFKFRPEIPLNGLNPSS